MHQAVKEDFSEGQDHKRASFFTLRISVFAMQKCAENPRNIFIYSFILGAVLLFFILRMEGLSRTSFKILAHHCCCCRYSDFPRCWGKGFLA